MNKTVGCFLIAAFSISTMAIPDGCEAGTWDSLTLSGDFRYRHEMISDDGSVDDGGDTYTRQRQRIRVRVLLQANVTESIDFGLRLATGSDDPVSTNQTLGSGFSSKGVQLDLAYFDLHPDWMKGLHIVGGKMKNPYHRPGKTGLIWDGDLTPEGFAIKYKTSVGETGIFFNTGGFWVSEIKTDSDVLLFGGQGGAMLKIGAGTLTVGAGIYSYTEAEDNLGQDYDELEGLAELGVKVGNVPVTLLGNYVINSAADAEDTGMLIGFMAGKRKAPGSWDLKILYESLETNAVYPELTDSDFGGGGTDAKGLILGAGYRVMEKADLCATYFLNTKNIAEGEEERDYNRLQMDFEFKF